MSFGGGIFRNLGFLPGNLETSATPRRYNGTVDVTRTRGPGRHRGTPGGDFGLGKKGKGKGGLDSERFFVEDRGTKKC